MRILQMNKFFWVKGGSERYYFDLMAALEGAGHEVVPLSMHHRENRPSPWSRHFVSEVDFHGGGAPWRRVSDAARFVWSAEARDRVRDVIREARPDVAHLHNVAHQLTPSILEPLHDAGIPVVQTLHDYKLICSSYLLFADGEVCERCVSGDHLQAVRQRCHHGSLAKSVLGALEMSWHARRGSYDPVDRFICPSRFMQAKCAEFGVGADRLHHLPYFLDVERYRPDPEPGDYVLYLGRLSREKGVGTLLRAAGRRSGRPLRVVGDGPLRDALEADASAQGADVTFEGYLSGDALHDCIRGAAFVVVPSEWYENLPYAVLESFALGKPVLGARMGGIPELVRDGETGAGFAAGDVDGLARAWESLESSRDRLREMGANARRRIETEFDRDSHVSHLVDLYRGLAA